MKIQNHLLFADDGKQVPFVSTPNVGKSALKPRFLVMHFTAGGSAKESIGWLASPQARASAHVVIDRDGTVTQMVRFDRVAWHAGASTWKGINGLNSYSFGIELDNPGRLTKKSGQWVSDAGRKYPEADVVVATHKNESQPSGWYRYPQAQLDAAMEVARAIVRAYGLEDVIGHDDISPGRKCDPGPAFPMADFRAAVLAKTEALAAVIPLSSAGDAAPQPAERQPVEPQPAAAQPTPPPAAGAPSPAGPLFRVTTTLRIHGGPGVEHELVAGSPLPEGTLVYGFEDQGEWKRVKVQGSVNHLLGVAGWVASRYLEAVVAVPTIAGEPAAV